MKARESKVEINKFPAYQAFFIRNELQKKSGKLFVILIFSITYYCITFS